jgi:hypothetical protein
MEIKISFTPGDKGRDAICGCQQAKNAAIHPRSAPEWALVGAIGSFAGGRDWVQAVALAQLGITNGEPSTGARLPKESPSSASCCQFQVSSACCVCVWNLNVSLSILHPTRLRSST